MQRHQLGFDSLLKDKFFEKPIARDKIDFKTPPDKQTLNSFFEQNGDQFSKDVAGLVERLKKIALEMNVFDDEAKEGVDEFVRRCYFRQSTSPFYIDDVYPLLTDGVKDLACILSIIEKDRAWSDSTKTEIQIMMHDLKACEPVETAAIRRAKSNLQVDLRSMFLRYRERRASSTAGQVVVYYVVNNLYEFKVGSQPHYATSMKNAFHDILGLDEEDDGYLKDYIATVAMKRDFIDLMPKFLTADYVIDSIMQEGQEFLLSLKPDDVSKLVEWLDTFGRVKVFNRELISNEIETTDKDGDIHYSYFLKSNNEHYIIHALFMRLVESGYFDDLKMRPSQLDAFSDVIIHIPIDSPSIKVAYVEPKAKSEANEPFVMYYMKKFMEDVQSCTNLEELEHATNYSTKLVELCSEVQRKALHDETKLLIIKAWPSDDKQYLANLLDRFNEQETRLLLMRLLVGAGKYGDRLAKGMSLLLDAKLLDENMINYLCQHKEHADSLVQVLLFFHQEFNYIMDETLCDYVLNFEDQADDFAGCIKHPRMLDKIKRLIASNILDINHVVNLLSGKYQYKDLMVALAALSKVSPTFCRKYIDAILAQGANLDLLKMITITADWYGPQQIELLEAKLNNLVANEQILNQSLPLPAEPNVELLFSAVFHESLPAIEMLLAKGIAVDQEISVKCEQLQDNFADTKPVELAQLFKEKMNDRDPNPEAELKITVKELAAVTGNKEILALLKDEPTVANVGAARSIFQAPPTASQSNANEQADPQNQPGSPPGR